MIDGHGEFRVFKSVNGEKVEQFFVAGQKIFEDRGLED